MTSENESGSETEKLELQDMTTEPITSNDTTEEKTYHSSDTSHHSYSIIDEDSTLHTSHDRKRTQKEPRTIFEKTLSGVERTKLVRLDLQDDRIISHDDIQPKNQENSYSLTSSVSQNKPQRHKQKRFIESFERNFLFKEEIHTISPKTQNKSSGSHNRSDRFSKDDWIVKSLHQKLPNRKAIIESHWLKDDSELSEEERKAIDFYLWDYETQYSVFLSKLGFGVPNIISHFRSKTSFFLKKTFLGSSVLGIFGLFGAILFSLGGAAISIADGDDEIVSPILAIVFLFIAAFFHLNITTRYQLNTVQDQLSAYEFFFPRYRECIPLMRKEKFGIERYSKDSIINFKKRELRSQGHILGHVSLFRIFLALFQFPISQYPYTSFMLTGFFCLDLVVWLIHFFAGFEENLIFPAVWGLILCYICFRSFLSIGGASFQEFLLAGEVESDLLHKRNLSDDVVKQFYSIRHRLTHLRIATDLDTLDQFNNTYAGFIGFGALSVVGLRAFDNDATCVTPYVGLGLVLILILLGFGLSIQITHTAIRIVLSGSILTQDESVILSHKAKKARYLWKNFFPIEKIAIFQFLRIFPFAFVGFLFQWTQRAANNNCSAPQFFQWPLFILPFFAFLIWIILDLLIYLIISSQTISSSLSSHLVFLLFPKWLRHRLPLNQPLIIIAAHSGSTEDLENLIDAGADIQETDSTQKTSLHMVAISGASESCAVILKAVKNLKDGVKFINQKDAAGDTALALALFYRHKHIVKDLLDYGADPNGYTLLYGNQSGYPLTFLQAVIIERRSPLLQILVSRTEIDLNRFYLDTDPQETLENEYSTEPPLHLAVRDDYLKGVQLLLGFDENGGRSPDYSPFRPPLLSLTNRQGLTVFDLVSQTNTGKKILRLLKRYGESVSQDFDYGKLTVHIDQVQGITRQHVISHTIDPFISIYMKEFPFQKYQTEIHTRDSNPVFDETCCFLCYPDLDILRLDLYDEDILVNQLLTSLDVALRSIDLKETQVVPLFSGKGSLTFNVSFRSFLKKSTLSHMLGAKNKKDK